MCFLWSDVGFALIATFLCFVFVIWVIFSDYHAHRLGTMCPGGTPIFSHIRRLGSFFGFKILNFNIFGGFQKKIIFFGV